MNPFVRVLRELPQAARELDLLPKIEQLANADDLASARRIVEDTPALLGELASSLILELAATARRQGNEAIAQTLEDYLALLDTARSRGIEQAFGDAAALNSFTDLATGAGPLTDIPPQLAGAVQQALAAQRLYGIARQRQDLDEAVNRWRWTLAQPEYDEATPAFRRSAARSAAVALATRFEQRNDPADLDTAIDLWRLAASLSLDDAGEHKVCLTYLGHALRARAKAAPGNAANDLDDAVATYRAARQLASSESTPLATCNLAASLHARYRIGNNADDLDEAIALYGDARSSLRLYARSAPDVLEDQGRCFVERYQVRGDPDDLYDGIAALRLAAQRTPHHSVELVDRLHSLGAALVNLYDLEGDKTALDEAIQVLQTAVQITPAGDPAARACAETLAGCMRRFYARAGLAV